MWWCACMARFIQASWISFQIKKNCKSLGISRGRFFYVLTGGKTCARDVNTLCENRLWRCTLGLISSPFLLVHRAWHSSTQSQEVLCTCSEQHKAFPFRLAMVSYAIVVKYSTLTRPLHSINLTHHSELWKVIVLSSPLMSLGQNNSQ